ncbi:MAG: ABC transporter permease [Clostridia bacterium]|nr:ABC transporter permease [Clostridia bacterium]
MRFNVISYLLGEGFSNIFKNKKSTISSLMIMCATMFVFGLFFVIGENINAFVANVAEAQGIRVFVTREATDEQIEQVGKDLLAIEGVRNAEYISKDDALESMKDWLGEETVDGYDKRNIFPASYDVTLTDLELNEDVQESILQIENVEEIRSSNQTIAQIIRLARGIKIVTAAILVLLIIISIAIISNTIKLTVHARRKEISIMKYVGATNSFIRWPFLVEGIVIGILSGILSVAIIGAVYTFIADKMATTDFMQMVHWKLLEFKDMFSLIITVYMGLGIGIGAIGSGISMRKYLEV